MSVTYHYTYKQIADAYKEVVHEKTRLPVGKAMMNRVEGANTRSLGATSAEIVDRIENGYTFPHMPETNLPDAGEGEGSRWYYTDDPSTGGEYQYDMDEAGEMEYYLARKPVTGKPGIKLRISAGFIAGVRTDAISKFGAWVGSLIQTLEENEYDLEIDFFKENKNVIEVDGTSSFEIEVTKFGEPVFFEDFAVFFSPGGYRHLMWFTLCMPAFEGKKIKTGLGMPTNKAWEVRWDSENRTLLINTNAQSSEFPEEDMNAKLAEAVAIIQSEDA